MWGAIIGDIVGSRFEFNNIKSKNFELFTPECHFTDDTAMTIAVGKALVDSDGDYELFADCVKDSMQLIGRKYPRAGYGGKFRHWLTSHNPHPYNSYGNGSAMRVSPCGFAADNPEEAKHLSYNSSYVTHNHYEGIKGAEATAMAIYLAKNGKSMAEIKDYITGNYYQIDFTLDDIREGYTFDVSCQGSVPQAFEAFFESTSFEDAIRNAVSIGGDSDTIGAITGAIAQAYYGIPQELIDKAKTYLDNYLTEQVEKFYERYM